MRWKLLESLMCGLLLVWAWFFAFVVVVFGCFFVGVGFLLFLNKNDKTQNILNVNFGGRLVLCFTPEMLLSWVDYLVNMLQGLFYTGLNSHWGHKGIFFFFVLVRTEFLDFSTIFARNWKFEEKERNITATKCRHGLLWQSKIFSTSQLLIQNLCVHARIALKSSRDNEKTSGKNFALSLAKLYLAKVEWSIGTLCLLAWCTKLMYSFRIHWCI